VSAWLATVAEAVDALAAADPARRRFGARHHAYALAPPLAADALAALEARLGATLPEDHRAFVAGLSAGGAGPYLGLVPVERAAALVVRAPRAGGPWQRALGLGHVGCGYLAVLALDGDARGEVWLDARAIGVVTPMYPSFAAFYLDWIARLARAEWPSGFVPAGACALPGALSGYLALCEQRRGLAPGSLVDDALRDELGALGPGAIALAADDASPFFAPEDPVDPCVVCEQLLEALGHQGLDRAAVAAGVSPIPQR
jgi:hypothetical protein